MVEYHIVRQGVDEQAISDLRRSRFEEVRVISYWSNPSELVQRLGQHCAVSTTCSESLLRTNGLRGPVGRAQPRRRPPFTDTHHFA
jgi:hypothetical protein